ncbi:MAG: immune inhibitor A, partial [Chloroflexi bacterium]|nr:immune inhibitor A [Chloroflexota bacterium]
DGIIDRLWIVHSGYGEEDGTTLLNRTDYGESAVWSHSSSVSPPYEVAPGIFAGPYIMMPENGGIGVFAHEAGHNLGADDLYAYGLGETSAGFWTLMADDWTGYPIGFEPPAVDPWHLDNWGWLDPLVITDPTQVYEVTLGQASSFPAGEDMYRGAKIVLPEGVLDLSVPVWQGDSYWWGGKEDLANAMMTTVDPIAIPAAGATLAFDLVYDIEDEWDFLWIQASVDGETWNVEDTLTNENTQCVHDPGWIGGYYGFPEDLCGAGLGGFYGYNANWPDPEVQTFDLSAYAGQSIYLRFWYMTDWAATYTGAFVDDVAVTADGAILFEDDAESGDAQWDYEAPWQRSDGTQAFTHNFYLQWRNVNNNGGYDSALGDERWRFGPANTGLLVWYNNNSYSDNEVWNYLFDYPGFGAKGRMLVVDSHPEPYRDPWMVAYGYNNEGGNVLHRSLMRDAPFTLQDTVDFTMEPPYVQETTQFFGQPAVSEFHDSMGYYPGAEYVIRGPAYPPDQFKWVTKQWDASVVIPATQFYGIKAPGYTANEEFRFNCSPILSGPYTGYLSCYWLGADTGLGYDDGTGNPGDYAGQYGWHVVLIEEAADHTWGRVRIYNDQAEPIISEVKVANVRDTSFTVSWITNIPSDGGVNYGTAPAALDQTANDDRGAGTSDDTHYVTLLDLIPETTYYFDLVSDGTVDGNGGAHYTVTTGPTIGLPAVDTIYGQVFKEDETTPAEGAIVYIVLQDANGSDSPGKAAPLSALVDGSGYWYTNLGNARTADLSSYFDYSASGDEVHLRAQGAADGVGCQMVDTADDTPADDIVLNVSPCGWPIDLEIGWNHVSLPVEPATSYTAEGVCDEIISQGGDVAEVDRWYASGWDGHICGLPFNDFAIELGSDYFIKSSAVITWTIEGYPVTTSVPLDLEIGWNSIGIPHTEAYTAESLCEEINDQCGEGVAVEVDRWHASGWDGHICGLPFNNFAIEIGKGYFVKASGACAVTPSLAALSGRWRMEVGDWRMENGGWRLDFQHPTSNIQHPTSITGVKATNVRDTSFTVSWSTDVIATGWVNYGTSPANTSTGLSTSLGQTAYDDRGANTVGKSHHVTLYDLSPQTTYYFEVISGATVDDHKGSGYQATTGPTLELPASDSIYGQAFESDGVTPAEGAIVYVTLRDADGAGSPGGAGVMSALVDADGWWQANLGNARLADGTGYFTYSAAGDAVTLVAQGVDDGFVSRTVDTGDLGPTAQLILARQRRPYLPLVVKE